MQILKRIAKAFATPPAATGGLTVLDVEKRNGVYVSRPVTNGQEWHDWATKWGIPSPLAADDFHVTVVYSTVDVKMIPDSTVRSIYIGPGYGDAAVFAKLGPVGESLCVCFGDWDLYNRHYNYLSNGAVTKWPTYRPHMTISNDAKDFDLSDEALADAPIYIHLGGEVSAPLKDPSPDDQVSDGADDMEADDVDVILVVEIACTAAKALIAKSMADSKSGLNPLDKFALADIAAGRGIQKGVARRLAAVDGMPQEIKDLTKAAPAPVVIEVNGKKYIEKTLTMTVAPISAEMQKKLGPKIVDRFKVNEEEKLAYGWASVSKINGVYVVDLQGDTITTKAQRQWLHSLFRSQREGLMEHAGPPIAEVVEGVVFDDDLQKALGIDLGMEGVVCGTHYTCDKTWDMVKTGNWMHSIAGRVLIEVEEG